MAITKTSVETQTKTTEHIDGREVEIGSLEEEYYETAKNCPMNNDSHNALVAKIASMESDYEQIARECPRNQMAYGEPSTEPDRAELDEMARDYRRQKLFELSGYRNAEDFEREFDMAHGIGLRGDLANLGGSDAFAERVQAVLDAEAKIASMEEDYMQVVEHCPRNEALSQQESESSAEIDSEKLEEMARDHMEMQLNCMYNLAGTHNIPRQPEHEAEYRQTAMACPANYRSSLVDSDSAESQKPDYEQLAQMAEEYEQVLRSCSRNAFVETASEHEAAELDEMARDYRRQKLFELSGHRNAEDFEREFDMVHGIGLRGDLVELVSVPAEKAQIVFDVEAKIAGMEDERIENLSEKRNKMFSGAAHADKAEREQIAAMADGYRQMKASCPMGHVDQVYDAAIRQEVAALEREYEQMVANCPINRAETQVPDSVTGLERLRQIARSEGYEDVDSFEKAYGEEHALPVSMVRSLNGYYEKLDKTPSIDIHAAEAELAVEAEERLAFLHMEYDHVLMNCPADVASVVKMADEYLAGCSEKETSKVAEKVRVSR